jgi:hypothetical protein
VYIRFLGIDKLCTRTQQYCLLMLPTSVSRLFAIPQRLEVIVVSSEQSDRLLVKEVGVEVLVAVLSPQEA